MAQVRAIQARAVAILDVADAAGDNRTTLSAVREAQGALQLRAQLSGALREHVEVEVEARQFVAEWHVTAAPGVATGR